MAQEINVNRVHQTPHLILESEKVSQDDAPTMDTTFVQLALDEVVDASVQQAAKDLAAPIIREQVLLATQNWGMSPAAVEVGHVQEDPADNIGNVAQEVISRAQAISYAQSLQSFKDYASFKASTIAAFKHLGLDTKKFFQD